MSFWDGLDIEITGVYETYVMARCPHPDHEDVRASAIIGPVSWRCLACEQGGLTKNLREGKPVLRVQSIESPFTGPLNHICIQAYRKLTNKPGTGGKYLLSRGITEWQRFRLGRTKDFIIIPVFSGKTLVGATARNLDLESRDKYVEPARQKQMLYAPDWELLDRDYLIVVFGIFDALTLCQMDYPCVTWIRGSYGNSYLLDDFRKPIFLIPDKGEEKPSQKLASQLGWRGHVCYYPYGTDEKDLNEVLVRQGEEPIRRYLNGLADAHRNGSRAGIT